MLVHPRCRGHYSVRVHLLAVFVRYRIEGILGSGTFSTVYSARHAAHNRPVALKCVRGDKECMDTGLGEARVQALICRHDPHGRHHLARLLDCFYFREHLFLVSEQLNASILAHSMHLRSIGPLEHAAYWRADSLGRLAVQILDALHFLASIGIAVRYHLIHTM